ncbi:response regulator transcription factor [Cohnella soli]|uniref:Response regulator n=1 Tax=Cohnella soli TaxID=425005 RepID=A0ABW0I7G3_9BACL
MNSVLFVDDEPLIVDNLFHFLAGIEEMDLLLWKAYSALEAIDIMQNNRIDILFTDVRMPGMSGLELIGHVRKHWPRCKVVFLSGYSDYEYLQTALRHDAFDYLLKPVDNLTIVDVLRRVISEFESEIQTLDVITRAEQQLRRALNLLQNEFLDGLLKGGPLPTADIRIQVRDLEIPLDPNHSVILLIGRVDRWPTHQHKRDKLLLQYAIGNIVEEYVNDKCRFVSHSDERYVVWLFQTHYESAGQGEEVRDMAKFQWYLNELLEKIQQTIRQYLHLPVSFVLSKPDVSWQQIPHTYGIMCELMQRGIGLDEQIIMIEQADDMLAQFPEKELAPQDVQRHMSRLANLLETDDKATFQDELMRFFRSMQQSVFLDYAFQLEIYSRISTMFLSFMNGRKMTAALGGQIDLDDLTHYRKHVNWSALEEYFLNLSTLIFSYADTERKDQKKEIVYKVDAYIVNSLNRNISLTELAKQVHLSPYYLSRLYHMEKGVSLFESIKELKLSRAKELLLREGYKVQDVAIELGFDNVPYFTRFFKKHIGITPMDYKQSNKV